MTYGSRMIKARKPSIMVATSYLVMSLRSNRNAFSWGVEANYIAVPHGVKDLESLLPPSLPLIVG